MATATRPRDDRARRSRRRAPSELRAALERTLAEVDADERIGPLIGATGLRLRFEFTDLGLVLNLAAGEDGDRNLALVVRRRPRLDAEARRCG